MQQADGSPLFAMRRQITINHLETSTSDTQPSTREKKFLVPDNGIVEYSFIAGENTQSIMLAVSMKM